MGIVEVKQETGVDQHGKGIDDSSQSDEFPGLGKSDQKDQNAKGDLSPEDGVVKLVNWGVMDVFG